MSRATSPDPVCTLPISAKPQTRLCRTTMTVAHASEYLAPGCRIVLVQSVQAHRYHTGVAHGQFIYCVGCFSEFTESTWRHHTYAPRRPLLSIGPRMQIVPMGALVASSTRFYCCDQTKTLGCKCHPRTGWIVISTADDALKRLGFTVPRRFSEMSLTACSHSVRADPTLAAAELNINATHWLTTTFDKMVAAPVYAVTSTLTLAFDTSVDSRLQLRPFELEVVFGLLRTAEAKCPITCRCSTGNCLRAVRSALKEARLTCNILSHNLVCYKCQSK